MRYLAWPALVASLTLIVILMGLPSTLDLPSAQQAPGVQMDNPTDVSFSPEDPTQHRPPSSSDTAEKFTTFPGIESDHSGINEKARP